VSKIELAHQSVPPGAPSAGNIVVYAKTDNTPYWQDDVGVEHQMGGGAGISAGTQSAASGTVVFSNSNNVTFGMSGSTQVTARIRALQGLVLGTQTQTMSTQALADQNGFSWAGFGGSLIILSGDQVRSISAGTTAATGSQVVFSNSNNITFGANGQTITASASFAAQTTQPAVNAAAGTQTATSGTVVFSNSNNVTFGMSGSSQITASASFPAQTTQPAINAAAGTQTATSGTVVWSNSNNVTFGMSGSSRITASASFPAQTTQPAVNAAAGTQTATSGTVIFSNSNGLTFGMAGSATITGSYSQSTAPGAIAAGTQTATSGTVVMADSNGFQFGMSGSTAVTLNVTKGSYYEFLGANALVAEAISQNSVMLQRIVVPTRIDATQMDVLLAISNSSSAAGSVTIQAGIYTMSGSTASLASSTSRTWAYNSTLAASSYTAQSGTRYRSIALGTWSVTPGDYLFGMVISVATALTSGTYSWYGHRDLTLNGADFVTVYSKYMNHGVYGTTTNAVPNSIQLSQISQVGGGGDNNFFPWFNLVGTF